MVHTGVHARDDHRPWRRLTRDAWIMADVAVLSRFLHITGLYVEEHIGLLVENSPDVTDGHGGIIHLIPLPIASLDVTEVMSSMTAESRVDQHSVQSINQGLPLGLRHKGPHVQVLWIFYILCDFATAEVCKSFEGKSQHIATTMNCKSL